MMVSFVALEHSLAAFSQKRLIVYKLYRDIWYNCNTNTGALDRQPKTKCTFQFQLRIKFDVMINSVSHPPSFHSGTNIPAW